MQTSPAEPFLPPLSGKVFFSYATVAPMSTRSYQAVQAFIDEFYTVGPPEVLYHYDPLIDELAAEAATLLHCEASEITYIKNTTEGIIIASEALPLESGDEVLVQANEYPANLLPWLKKRKDGVRVTVVPGNDNVQAFEDLIAAIGPRTKAIAISAAQYYDGFMPDIARLSAICRNKHIFLVLDAVQTVGIRRIDLQETPVDFLVCGGQKYLQAGMGCGFLYVNKHTMPALRDTKVGIRSMQHFDETGYTLKPGAARFQDGTQNMPGIVALHAALKHVNEVGIANLERQSYALLHDIKACLTRHNIPFIDHGDRQGNIVSLPVADPAGLSEFLKQHQVYIKPIKDVARLSFVPGTTMRDVETLAELVRQWLSQ